MNNKKLIKKQYLKSINQQNSRKWSKKHQSGGTVMDQYQNLLNSQNQNSQQYIQNEELKQQRKEQMHWQQVKQAQSLGQGIGNIVGSMTGQFGSNAFLENEDEDLKAEYDKLNRIDTTKMNAEQLEAHNKKLQSIKDSRQQLQEQQQSNLKTFAKSFNTPTMLYNDTTIMADPFLSNLTKQNLTK